MIDVLNSNVDIVYHNMIRLENYLQKFLRQKKINEGKTSGIFEFSNDVSNPSECFVIFVRNLIESRLLELIKTRNSQKFMEFSKVSKPLALLNFVILNTREEERYRSFFFGKPNFILIVSN